MIRLTAEPAEDRYAFTLSRDTQVLFTSIDPIEVAERMLALGIETRCTSWNRRGNGASWRSRNDKKITVRNV